MLRNSTPFLNPTSIVQRHHDTRLLGMGFSMRIGRTVRAAWRRMTALGRQLKTTARIIEFQ